MLSLWWWFRRARSNNPDLRSNAIKRLARHGGADVARKLTLLLVEEHDVWEFQRDKVADESCKRFRTDVTDALKTIGEPAVEPLIELLNHRHSGPMLWAAKTLGQLGDKRAIAPLTQTVVNHRVAADDLFAVGGAEAMRRLLRAGDVRIKYAALSALARKGNGEPADVLVSLLSDKDPSVRIGALECLAKSIDPAVREKMIPLGDDPDADVRKTAIGVLRNDQGAAATEMLRRRVDDPDRHLAKDATTALAQRDPAQLDKLRQALHESGKEEQLGAIAVLEELGDRGFDVLVEALQHADPSIRRASVDAVGSAGSRGQPRAVALLVERLKDVPDVAGAAAFWTGVIGDRAAGEPLYGTLQMLAAQDKRYLRRQLTSAMAYVGDPRAAALVLNQLDASSDFSDNKLDFKALERLVERSAAELEESELERISRVADVGQFVTRTDEQGFSSKDYEVASAARLRQLAAQELERRRKRV